MAKQMRVQWLRNAGHLLVFILRVIDEPVLRMSIENGCSAASSMSTPSRAVSVGNPREFLQAEKEDQEMAEACKRLINVLARNCGQS
jgi:hypothetical protein